jgi:hypothetical protein
MGQDDKKENWKETLYIWDGIVTVGTSPSDKENDNEATVPMSWEGTWVAVEAADAKDAAAPKRNAFAEYVDSDLRFVVTGTSSPTESKEDEKQEHPPMHVVKLAEGDGWDMENDGKKDKYQDKDHDVLVKTLRWSGNTFDQTENLIVAKGHNEFGPFISIGWMRPGNRWTLARRYLSDEESDPRAKWTLEELQKYVQDETVEVVEATGQKKLRIPPWHCTVLHSEYHEPPKRGEKRKLEKEAGDDDIVEKQAKQ